VPLVFESGTFPKEGNLDSFIFSEEGKGYVTKYGAKRGKMMEKYKLFRVLSLGRKG
jgi:hypothetical protein